MSHSNPWTIPSFGEGPPLPPEVKVELENRELWQQFHAETTEMIITKLGRWVCELEYFFSGIE